MPIKAKPPIGTTRVIPAMIFQVIFAGTQTNPKYKRGSAKITASAALRISNSPNNRPLSVKLVGML
jgi:hypothetical protein